MTVYLVDTNIIIAYINNEDPKLIDFVNNPNNKFFYTDTVKKEVNAKIPHIFNFVETKICPNRIDGVFSDLSNKCSKFHNFSPPQITKFKNDLTIIFESSYVCYDITDVDDLREPYLLTHNLKLYKKFISDPLNKKCLEELINQHGFEHLIEICRPQDVIANY